MRASYLLLGLLGVTAIMGACSTETVVHTAPATTNDGGAVDNDGGADPPEPLDGAVLDRAVSGTWEKVDVHPADGDPIKPLTSVLVRGPDDVYTAEGASNLGTGFYHWDGKLWTGVRYSGFATKLSGLASGEVLGFGTEIFVKAKSGGAWNAFPDVDGAQIFSLWGVSRSSIYASTSAGNMHFDGSAWSAVPKLEVDEGNFDGTSAKDLWFASAQHGVLSHFDGTAWTKHFDKLPADLETAPPDGPYGVFASGPDDVWAMGRARTLVHYDGAAWTIVAGPGDEWGCNLTHGWASSKKNAWLVGSGGCVFHWDGAAWKKTPSGVTTDIYSIHGADPEHVWIAPSSTTSLLRLKPE